ncbi:uncharacterized protein LOC100181492 [Ciona intestinalis]
MDLLQLENWEREAILEVLKRQNALQEREERRINQLAVRVQLQRVNDSRSARLESEIKTKTGQWHREILRRRYPGAVAEPPVALLKRISSEIQSLDSSTSWSSTASTSHRTAAPPSRCRSRNGTDLAGVREWVENITHCNDEGKFLGSSSDNDNLTPDEQPIDIQSFHSESIEDNGKTELK